MVILEKLIGLQLVEIFMHVIQPNCFYCVHKSLEKCRFAEHDTLKLAGMQWDLCMAVIEDSQ
jgi:replication initiation and membrane attachment protein DnaB